MTDRWDEEARRLLGPGGTSREWRESVAAALRGAYEAGRATGRADVAKYSNAVGQIEAAIGYAGARPLRETVQAVRAMAARLAPDQPATPRDGGVGERCGTCGGTRRTKFLIRHEGRGPTSEERDCPACTKPAAPPAPVTLMGMDLVCDPSVPPGEVRLASAPAPVTYRAGTVPPVVWCETCREPRPNPHCPACEERPLARDWTEPGGDGGDDDEA
jgi:hypothetical protein